MEIAFEGCRYFHTVTNSPQKERFNRHSHKLYEILYLYSGDVNYIIENNRCKLAAGDLVFIDCARPHYVEICSDVPYERAVIDFDASVTDARLLSEAAAAGHVFAASNDAGDCFRRLDAYAGLSKEYQKEILMRGVLSELLSLIANTAPVDKFQVHNAFLTEVLLYIEEHLTEIHTMDEICAALFVSPSYLYKTFTNTLKMSPMLYVRRQRLQLAHRLLQSGERPVDVCTKCGFTDYSVFYRAYKTFYGYKPSA